MSVPMSVQVISDSITEMVSGDTGTVLDAFITDLQGNVVDLSAVSSAWIRFKVGSGAVQLKQMAMAFPFSQGRLTYQFAAADTLNQFGTCQYEVFTKDGNGNVLNTQLTPGAFQVRAPLS